MGSFWRVKNASKGLPYTAILMVVLSLWVPCTVDEGSRVSSRTFVASIQAKDTFTIIGDPCAMKDSYNAQRASIADFATQPSMPLAAAQYAGFFFGVKAPAHAILGCKIHCVYRSAGLFVPWRILIAPLRQT
jgi:hypothetical protein